MERVVEALEVVKDRFALAVPDLTTPYTEGTYMGVSKNLGSLFGGSCNKVIRSKKYLEA